MNRFEGNPLSISWPWRITIGYLLFMLILPITALLSKASEEMFENFWSLSSMGIS